MMIAAAWSLAWAAAPLPDGLQPPLREDDHPTYLDAKEVAVRWSQVRSVARQTDVMRRVRRRRAGRTALRVLFTGAAVAEGFGTAHLVRRDSEWAWVLGAQTGFTALAAGLLWADIPRSQRIDRAEMLDAANAWLRTSPGAR
jgi:hypothetical protein